MEQNEYYDRGLAEDTKYVSTPLNKDVTKFQKTLSNNLSSIKNNQFSNIGVTKVT